MSAKNDHLLETEIPFDLTADGKRKAWTPLHACPAGAAIWEQYRMRHSEAPAIPPENAFDWSDPDAAAYFAHTGTCPDCNEE